MRNGAGITPSVRHTVFTRDDFTCKRCGIVGYARKRPSRGYAYPTEKDGLFLTIDHIHPRAKGGSNDEDNLQTLCHDCNRLKSDNL